MAEIKYISGILKIVLIVAVVAGIYYISTFNYFKRQRQEIEKHRSGIEIALTNRYDTLVKLNKTVCGYTGHEAGTFENITKLRKGMKAVELAEVENQQIEALSGISMPAENYPELKASNNFMQLQNTINDLESTIRSARRIYNNEVSEYNSKIETFPSNFVAKRCNVQPEAYFEAEARKIQDVELNF